METNSETLPQSPKIYFIKFLSNFFLCLSVKVSTELLNYFYIQFTLEPMKRGKTLGPSQNDVKLLFL